MSIELKDGNIFNSDCQAWVNPVNCVGVMGAGLALQFKRRFPAMFAAYRKCCEQRSLKLGGVFCWDNDRPPPTIILCAATKDHFRDRSTQSGILLCLENIADECTRLGIDSVAIPALGCGLGGLQWDVFCETAGDAEQRFGDVRVVIYKPCEDSDTKMKEKVDG